MNNTSEIRIGNKSVFGDIVSCFFGVLFLGIGFINTFWGNDLGFGVFIIFLSLVYFPIVSTLVKEISGFSIPVIAKVVLGILILWASLGVGELFDKIDLMLVDL